MSQIQFDQDCEDPDSDKLLDLALNGRADAIVSGDRALLKLHPWRGMSLLSPRDYLSIGR